MAASRGARRPTITGIANQAGVSTAAVSYALNGRPGVSSDTRDRILSVANDLGWRPSIAARSLSVNRAHAIGLVLARPFETLGVEPFFMRFILGLEQELSGVDAALLLQVVEDHKAWNATVEAWSAERRIDGVVVTDVHVRDSRFEMLERLGIPAVIAGRPQSRLSAPAVWSDDAGATQLAVDYLVSLGHRRIARVAGLRSFDHTRVRTKAFTAAMKAHGLDGSHVLDTDYTFGAGAEATRALLERDQPPTGIIYDSDLLAVAGLITAREEGVRVPDQLSIVAGDDSPLCLFGQPDITALTRDVIAYGAQTARTLIDLVAGRNPSSVVVDPPTLSVRGTTGPAPVAR